MVQIQVDYQTKELHMIAVILKYRKHSSNNTTTIYTLDYHSELYGIDMEWRGFYS